MNEKQQEAATAAGQDAAGLLRLDAAVVRISIALKQELLARLDGDGPVRIDGSAVERIDTAALQLLAAFSRDLHAASRQMQWCGHSPALEQAAATLGLGPVLGLTAAAASNG